VKVRFLYSEQCPSHDEALQRLRSVLHEEGVVADVEVVKVETFEEALREHYPGSPTIILDDRDIDPVTGAQYAPTCRAYRLEDGRISPLPSIQMIRRAVRNAVDNAKSTNSR
jgi:hypothetical protein